MLNEYCYLIYSQKCVLGITMLMSVTLGQGHTRSIFGKKDTHRVRRMWQKKSCQLTNGIPERHYQNIDWCK